MPDGRKALCSVCRGCCYQTPASITKPLQAERARFHGAPTACLMTTVEPAAPTTQTPQYWDGFKVLPPLNMRRRLSCRPQQQPPPAPWKCVAASMRIGTVSLSVVSPTFARTVGALTAPSTAPTASPRRLGVGHPHVTGVVHQILERKNSKHFLPTKCLVFAYTVTNIVSLNLQGPKKT